MRNRLSSIHLTAECNEVAEMYNPKRVCVPRYFEACKSKNNSVRLIQGSEAGTPQEDSENASAPVAPQMSNVYTDLVNKRVGLRLHTVKQTERTVLWWTNCWKLFLGK
ncbi:hypothetical protein ATANTOWER_030281 [Ataeniobius toweri]|uniref:Uncharacterized protein n=1 Tax=Ataeniobius toweri TaxID=208326 RepID=A0ABU7AU05_9TELE|nr:hypothetical protein [Ataeniobius toweri]